MATPITTCSLNIPPSSTSDKFSIAPLKINQNSWAKNGEGSWRSRCVAVGLACMIMGGAEMAPVTSTERYARAEDYFTVEQTEKKGTASRWSDRRACPPWESDKFVIIVPENLPRPFFHRNSESVILGRKFAVDARNKCFTM